ncbi:hypothetical protein PC116_g33156, partial [Phytophthora cactorum]
MAADVIVDSKASYPAACNSLETLLVQESALDTLLPTVAEALIAKGVVLRCDTKTKTALSAKLPSDISTKIEDAQSADYDTEFLSLTLAVKAVADIHEAIAHINAHGS